MSTKNKLSNKKLRKAERTEGDTAWEEFERKPLSGFPRAAAINVLTKPFPAKQTSPRRKRMLKALSSAILVPRIQPKDAAAKLTMDLQRVGIVRLIRTIKHSARHASTCKHLAEKCTPGSKVQMNLLSVQTFHLSTMKQAQAEYTVRTSPRA